MINLFLLDENIDQSAKYYIDSHVVKIILEMAMILCNVRHKLGIVNHKFNLYNQTHLYHPMNNWCSMSFSRYKFVVEYVRKLHIEFQFRFNKLHKSALLIEDIDNDENDSITDNFENINLPINPLQYMMPEFHDENGDYVLAYRKYYFFYKRFLVHKILWTKRDIPDWFNFDFFISKKAFKL